MHSRSPQPPEEPRAAQRPSERRYGVDLGKAWQAAKGLIRQASGLDVDREARKVRDPVGRARRMAEVAAPADMRRSLALGLGAGIDDLERDKAGARLQLEAAHRRLSIVGLRSGEIVETDVSDRMQDFLSRFFKPAGARRARGDSEDGHEDRE